MIHVRIDNGDAGSHCQHGFDRISALGKDRATVLDGGGVWSRDHATTMPGGVEVHAEGTSARPRFFRRASTVGRRPRNAV